jgi:hypothetical protein
MFIGFAQYPCVRRRNQLAGEARHPNNRKSTNKRSVSLTAIPENVRLHQVAQTTILTLGYASQARRTLLGL